MSWNERIGEPVNVQSIEGDFDDPLYGVVRLTRERESVDLVVGRWQWQKALIERSERLDLPSCSVCVPDVADLVLLKVDADRQSCLSPLVVAKTTTRADRASSGYFLTAA